MIRLPHPMPTKTAAGAAGLGAALPFLIGAAGPEAMPAEVSQALPWWAVLLISSASPACAWALSVLVGSVLRAAAAALKAHGRAALEDHDPSNDGRARAELAAAEELERRAERLDQQGKDGHP